MKRLGDYVSQPELEHFNVPPRRAGGSGQGEKDLDISAQTAPLRIRTQ